MGTVIAITSGKGGTGKTSITGGVACSLALMGRRVLCVDMDIGLRNLDISLGPLARAAVEHPDLKGLSLLTAPMTLPASLTAEKVTSLLNSAAEYDYILIDSPAGLGAGFRLATCAVDRAIVISTNDASSLRDAQRTVAELEHLKQIHLVMNRIQTKLLRKLRATIDDAMNAAGLPLIGVVPEDPQVILCANLGLPLTTRGKRGAALACWNIAQRLEGNRVPIMRIR